MKWLIKGAIVLLIACLISTIVGCGGKEAKEIKIGVIGPMSYVMGEHHWYGAQLAAQEINNAGGIKVGDDYYKIKLVQVDSNELLSVTDAQSAAERAITVDNVSVLMGGIRSEAVAAMQEVAMDNKVIFFGCGASDVALCTKVTQDYDRYKYWFRVTPVNGTYLAGVGFQLLNLVAQEIRSELGIMQPKVAILAEKNVFGDTMVAAANAQIPKMGMTVVGVWQPSPNATDLTAELSAIEAAGAQIIFTALSGPAGIPYAAKWGELQVPAASVGINVQAQDDGFWAATGGKGDYEMTMNIYARDVEITTKTKPFVDAFIAEKGVVPTYNAGTYDAVYILKGAIESAGSLDNDAIVTELEKTDYIGTAGRFMFDQTHDVKWGPGLVTAIGVQWQDGKLVGVWPPADGSWQNVVYPGIVDYKLPPWVIAKWKP